MFKFNIWHWAEWSLTILNRLSLRPHIRYHCSLGCPFWSGCATLDHLWYRIQSIIGKVTNLYRIIRTCSFVLWNIPYYYSNGTRTSTVNWPSTSIRHVCTNNSVNACHRVLARAGKPSLSKHPSPLTPQPHAYLAKADTFFYHNFQLDSCWWRKVIIDGNQLTFDVDKRNCFSNLEPTIIKQWWYD